LVAAAARVRFGDVLAYECEGSVVCHRVIGRLGDHLMTRADHSGAEPELVRRDQILGVVTALEHDGAVTHLTRPAYRARAVVKAARSLGAAAWATARRRAWRRAGARTSTPSRSRASRFVSSAVTRSRGSGPEITPNS